MSYNTHLMGTITGTIAKAYWKDDDRFAALETCVLNAQLCGADIISFEEIWSREYVEKLTSGSVSKLYPNACYDFHDGRLDTPTNPSGLLLLGNSRVTFDQNTLTYFDYITAIGEDNFGPQDQHDGKGYLKISAVVDKYRPLTVMNTHMPVQSSKYTTAIGDCFRNLASAVPAGHSPVLLMGDFNLSETSDTPVNGVRRFSDWVGPKGYLGQAGLIDVFRTLYTIDQNPGYSIISNTNTCWKHFNEDKVAANEPDFNRIDYVMCRGLTPVSMSVQGKYIGTTGSDYSDEGNGWIWLDNGNKRDISDHYPVMATLNF